MDNKKLLLKNSLLLSIAPFLPKIISVLLLPIMTKYLTAVDFGISATISAYSLSIGAFSTLGMQVVIQNSFYKYPTRYKFLWRQIYGFLNVWMIIFAIFQATLLYFVIPKEAAENKWLIIILTNFSTVFFGSTGLLGNSYFIYSKQAFPIVWRNLMASIITIASSFVLIVYFRYGYVGWYVSSFIGLFFTNATYWFVIRNNLKLKPIYNFKWRTIKNALFVSVPTIPHYYSVYLLNSSGRMILDQNGFSQKEIGKLGITQQFGDLFQTGINSLNQAVSPYFMQSLKNGNQQPIKKIGLAFVFFVFCLAFVAALWSKEIFQLLISNKSLQASYPYFIIYIMSISARPMYFIVSVYYFYFEETKKLLSLTFLSGIIACVLYLIFIPIYGIWAFLICHFIAHSYFCYSGYFYSVYRSRAKIKIPFFQIMLFQIASTVIAFIFVDYFVIKIVISLILLSVILYLFLKTRDGFKI